MIVHLRLLLNFNSKIFEDGAFVHFAVRVMGRVMAKHTLAFVVPNGLLPTVKMIVKQFPSECMVDIVALTCDGAGGICRRGLWDHTVFANGTRPRIIVKIDTLFDDCLQISFD